MWSAEPGRSPSPGQGVPHVIFYTHYELGSGPGSSVGIATDYGLEGPGSNPDGEEIFRPPPDRPWGPPSLLYNGYRIFPGGKVRPGRAADHSPPSSAAVMEQYSYISTHPLGHTGPVTGSLYLTQLQGSESLMES